MKKYTIIYGVWTTRGSHRSQATRMAHIECEPSQLVETIEEEIDNDMTAVLFLFDGHCQITQD